MLAGCVHLPDHQPVSWCESVKPLFTREGVTCLELAGSYSLTFFGPHSAPKRYSLAPCADGGAQPSRATENIGDYSTNYSYERKFDGAASLSLKGLTGLGWAPDLAAKTNGNGSASVSVMLKNARWVALSDVSAWLHGRLNSTRFDVSKQDVYESCRSTERHLCEPINEFAEEVVEATPVITVTATKDLELAISAGVDGASARFNIVDKGEGKTEITWGEPLTIGARVSASNGIVAPCL
jgi:hypothetical protein